MADVVTTRELRFERVFDADVETATATGGSPA